VSTLLQGDPGWDANGSPATAADVAIAILMAAMPACACGCGRLLSGRQRKYASKDCANPKRPRRRGPYYKGSPSYERARVLARFWSRVEKLPDAPGCWLWSGASVPLGYGKFSVDGAQMYAHRFAYSIANGVSVGPGTEVHHRCGVPSCVNPAHLQALRPEDHAAMHRELRTPRSVCAKGHALADAPVRSSGRRDCRLCRSAWGKTRKRDRRRCGICRVFAQAHASNDHAFIAGPTKRTVDPTRTHCRNGHELAAGNLMVYPSGWRVCRGCHRAADARTRAKRRAARNA
jgi:hypothetical protein